MRATVFGGSGFVGRYVVERLAERGVIVRIAVRDPVDAEFLKVAGDVGQVVPVRAAVTDTAAVKAAVEGVDWVVNLVGILYQRGRQTFRDVHVEGARAIAEAAAESGAKRLVHVSAIGADACSPAEYGRSKAAAEEAVRAAFPTATILRPSVIFGPEDGFFNLFAALTRLSPVLPVVGAMPRLEKDDQGRVTVNLIGDGGPRFQPVYVGDVADAIMAALERADAPGRTYELGGPRIYTFAEIMALILKTVRRRRLLLPLPLGAAAFKAWFLEWLPKPPLTRDQVRLLSRDNVVDPDALALSDLGIGATAAEGIVETYLDRFRPAGRFTRRAGA